MKPLLDVSRDGAEAPDDQNSQFLPDVWNGDTGLPNRASSE